MGSANFGKTLIIIGGLLVLVGLLVTFQDKLPFLKFFGRLPGDIYVKKDNVQFYFPVATSLLLSVILSLLFWFFRRE